VLSTLRLRVRAGLTRLVVRTKRLLHEASRPLPVVVGVLRDLTKSREQLIAENAFLRQQLIVASRKVKRSVFKDSERGLLVLLSRIVHGRQNAVLLVKPETIAKDFASSGVGSRANENLQSRRFLPSRSL